MDFRLFLHLIGHAASIAAVMISAQGGGWEEPIDR
jgi:hypothetical protein